MSLEADIRRDTVNLTPTRILAECGGEITPNYGLNLEPMYSPFDYKYLASNNNNNASTNNCSNLKNIIAESYDSDNRNVMSSAPLQDWSDIMFEESYLPMRQMTPGISPPPVSTSHSFYLPSSSTSPIKAFHPRMSMASDHLISQPEAQYTLTHEYQALYDNLVPFKKSYHSDPDLPQLSPDSPSPDSLVPTGIFRSNSITMANANLVHDSYPPQRDNNIDNSDNGEQDMSDVDYSDMDVDSNEHNDDQDTITPPSSQSSRDTSVASEPTPVKSRTRTSKRAAAAAAASAILSKSDAKTSTKTTSKSKKASTASKAKAKDIATTSAMAPGSKKSATKPVSVTKTLSQLRKHSSSEEESPEAKRQKFLERNRMAASKCREKKRLQTLKTIEDADVITARNQALHETLDDLQEEVRTLKNLILCHRDCGCDVIQKFVQSSFNVPSLQAQAPPTQAYFKRF
jgi:hypothetical protein